MVHDILLKLSYSCPPPSHTHLHNRPHTAQNSEAYIFACVNVRTLELLTQALWLIKFLQKKYRCSHLHVRSTIDRFSQSLIHLLVDLIEQSLIL